jgi:ATP-binding cassette subfamily B protein
LTYPDRDAPAVDDLALTIHSGQTVAFVGDQDFHKWPFTAATNIAIGDAAAEPDRARIESAAVRPAGARGYQS